MSRGDEKVTGVYVHVCFGGSQGAGGMGNRRGR